MIGDDSRMLRSRPCRICRHWFRPDPRIAERQRVCSAEGCQAQRQRDNVAAWVERHADYAIEQRIRARQRQAAKGETVDPLDLPPLLTELPWSLAQEQFLVQGSDFLGHFGRLLCREPKKPMGSQVAVNKRGSGGVPGEAR